MEDITSLTAIWHQNPGLQPGLWCTEDCITVWHLPDIKNPGMEPSLSCMEDFQLVGVGRREGGGGGAIIYLPSISTWNIKNHKYTKLKGKIIINVTLIWFEGTGKTIPLNSILEFSIRSDFKMRNVIIWHWFIKSLVGASTSLRRIDVVTTSCASWEFAPPLPTIFETFLRLYNCQTVAWYQNLGFKCMDDCTIVALHRSTGLLCIEDCHAYSSLTS